MTKNQDPGWRVRGNHVIQNWNQDLSSRQWMDGSSSFLVQFYFSLLIDGMRCHILNGCHPTLISFAAEFKPQHELLVGR